MRGALGSSPLVRYSEESGRRNTDVQSKAIALWLQALVAVRGCRGLFWVVPGVALLVTYLTLPDYNASGQCEGIGFGCVLTPKDGTQFVAMFLYPFVVVGGC